jgi:hypothetical protein
VHVLPAQPAELRLASSASSSTTTTTFGSSSSSGGGTTFGSSSASTFGSSSGGTTFGSSSSSHQAWPPLASPFAARGIGSGGGGVGRGDPSVSPALHPLHGAGLLPIVTPLGTAIAMHVLAADAYGNACTLAAAALSASVLDDATGAACEASVQVGAVALGAVAVPTATEALGHVDALRSHQAAVLTVTPSVSGTLRLEVRLGRLCATARFAVVDVA